MMYMGILSPFERWVVRKLISSQKDESVAENYCILLNGYFSLNKGLPSNGGSRSMGIRKIMPHLIWRFPVESEILNLETLYKWVLKTVYNQLLPNGHLVKADTSSKRTCGVGSCRTSVIYFISVQGGHLSKADSRSWSRACPPYREVTVVSLNLRTLKQLKVSFLDKM